MNRFLLSMYDNLWPILGGSVGAIRSAPITFYPDVVLEALLYSLAYAVIGGFVGYGVKRVSDLIFKKRCKED